MRALATAAFVLLSAPAFAASHPCEGDARARAGKLLAAHWNSDGSVLAETPGEPDGSEAQAWALDDAAKVLKPVKAAVGNGRFDVIELIGYVYKAEYRMRFLYAQIPDSCVLMDRKSSSFPTPTEFSATFPMVPFAEWGNESIPS